MLMHVCDSFGFNVNTFTHILEGYKVADKMKTHGVYASTFADWWAYKYEVIEAIPYNAAILSKMGVLTAINSDDAEMGRRLNHEAAKIVKYGNINEVDAWNMVTINPATMLHIDNITGSIKVGKDADLVLWTDNPLSVYARVLQTYVDGRCLYDSVRDVQQRTEISQLRMALISRMIEAVQGGEATSNKRSRRQMVYHCDTETEEMEELLND
jgi:alpha-D-ribose 1-methylphosphonate 5-triphosphate diphosphatase PhnM